MVIKLSSAETFQVGFVGAEAAPRHLTVGSYDVGTTDEHTDGYPGKEQTTCVERVGLIMVFKYKRSETNQFNLR